MENNTNQVKERSAMVISADALLEQWQGHRRLTRRVIEAFPEDKLFSYSVGGMRPFAELAKEMLTMAAPGIRGVVKGTWEPYEEISRYYKHAGTREELLRLWDETTEQINTLWPQITPERFQENDKFFGLYEGPIYWSVFYLIDNEIHHRGQGYVYLRSLGIEPPYFWERS